mmetsp:Transcript_3676/g.16139  ORF Transcript_3676/g.16139 Transcript_3676/m.16139 type:complete len:235 (+) Transcript_3676:2931-3635(+)
MRRASFFERPFSVRPPRVVSFGKYDESYFRASSLTASRHVAVAVSDQTTCLSNSARVMNPAETTRSANFLPFKLRTARAAPSVSAKSRKTSPTPAGSSNRVCLGNGITTRSSLPNPAHSSCVSSSISRASVGSVSSSLVTMLARRTHSLADSPFAGKLPGANPGGADPPATEPPPGSYAARLTLSTLSPRRMPVRPSIAGSSAVASAYSKNPYPFNAPVSLSTTRLNACTFPND